MQACVTKYFKAINPTDKPYYEFLFQKEEAEARAREEERQRLIAEVLSFI